MPLGWAHDQSKTTPVNTSPFLFHTSFFIIKKDNSLCYGLGMDMVHQDFPFQSIREKEFKREIKGMANS